MLNLQSLVYFNLHSIEAFTAEKAVYGIAWFKIIRLTLASIAAILCVPKANGLKSEVWEQYSFSKNSE